MDNVIKFPKEQREYGKAVQVDMEEASKLLNSITQAIIDSKADIGTSAYALCQTLSIAIDTANKSGKLHFDFKKTVDAWMEEERNQ